MREIRPAGKALVTGASRGIGLAVARALKKAGHAVTGTSRIPERYGGNVEDIPLLALDLGDDSSIRECARKVGDVDILVNNAGRSRVGPAEEIPLGDFVEDFRVNVFGTVLLTQRLLPRMREKGGGFIINIGSLAAEFPVPFQSSYAASKSALSAFTRSLRSEVGRYGVKVVLVEPYHILTPIE
ncbi:MAG: SDR family NAD(P)-dependent oxidoreductase, partial [Candidatus Aminicenantes bacterium]|nr:SDR family NAD(P)-dependent oxidoreductase [Candidatus Aminicenantes bacterium]